MFLSLPSWELKCWIWQHIIDIPKHLAEWLSTSLLAEDLEFKWALDFWRDSPQAVRLVGAAVCSTHSCYKDIIKKLKAQDVNAGAGFLDWFSRRSLLACWEADISVSAVKIRSRLLFSKPIYNPCPFPTLEIKSGKKHIRQKEETEGELLIYLFCLHWNWSSAKQGPC